MGTSRLTVVIRADASVSIGMGHRVRCDVLASAFASHGAQIKYVVHQSCQAFANAEDYLIDTDADWCVLRQQADLVILDHYGYHAQQIEQLWRDNPNLLILDDNNQRGRLHGRWLVNPVSLVYDSCFIERLMIGADFALLRSQFSQWRANNAILAQPDRLLITFGGTDPLSLTRLTIHALLQRGFPAENLLVMVGAGAQNTQDITTLCRQHGIEHQLAAVDVAALMQRARYAISAAGGTLFELACMGVPTYFVQVAINQYDALAEHGRHGWCEAYDFVSLDVDTHAKNMTLLCDKLIAQWPDERLWQRRSQKAGTLVDGLGAERIVSQILSDLQA